MLLSLRFIHTFIQPDGACKWYAGRHRWNVGVDAEGSVLVRSDSDGSVMSVDCEELLGERDISRGLSPLMLAIAI